MKKLWIVGALLTAWLLFQWYDSPDTEAQPAPTADEPPIFQVKTDVAIAKPYRIGINLGTWTSWGAEQYMRNVIMNPGFEGEIDRIIVIVSEADQRNFYDEKGWGFPDNHWNDATFEVLSGNSAGFAGKVTSSLNAAGNNGAPQFTSSTDLPPLAPKDIISLTKITDDNPVAQWWLSDNSKDRVVVDATQKAPNSSGKQSLRMTPLGNSNAQVFSYLDTIGNRVGKALPVNGPWKLSFWAKSQNGSSTIQASFGRQNGSAAYVDQNVQPTTEWKQYSFDFNAADTGAPELLRLGFYVNGDNDPIWIDDVWLGPVLQMPTNFRKDVVDVLRILRPSFIREMAPFGDTYENRVVDAFGRRSWRSRTAGGPGDLTFSYSLGEFLDLCKYVKANPWLIVPVTFTQQEDIAYGKYLAENANRNFFPEVIVEFGNENWNWLFRPQAIPYYEPHGKVADRAFSAIENNTGGTVALRKVVNGQLVNPWLSQQFIAYTNTANTISPAAYYLYGLEDGKSVQSNLQDLFADDPGYLKKTADDAKALGKNVAIYEVNAHTTEGNARQPGRDGIVAGMASGSALAKRLIVCMQEGYNPIMVTGFSQFDIILGTGEWERLWGIVRDLGSTKRFRPTGLAMAMLNNVIVGDLHMVQPGNNQAQSTGTQFTIATFSNDTSWSAAIVNGTGTPTVMELQFPEDGKKTPTYLLSLEAKSPTDTNEDAANVNASKKTLEINNRNVRFTVPAWGFVVLPAIR